MFVFDGYVGLAYQWRPTGQLRIHFNFPLYNENVKRIKIE